jgi:hypothetical protein
LKRELDQNPDPSNLSQFGIDAANWPSVRSVQKLSKLLAEYCVDADLVTHYDKGGIIRHALWDALEAAYSQALKDFEAVGNSELLVNFYNKYGMPARSALWAPDVKLTVFDEGDLPWDPENDDEFVDLGMDLRSLRAQGFDI